MLKARISGMKTGLYEYIDERNLRWFGHIKRMQNSMFFLKRYMMGRVWEIIQRVNRGKTALSQIIAVWKKKWGWKMGKQGE